MAGGVPLGTCRLFGHQVFGDKHDKRVVITEGELDAMSVAQATDFKFPCVSITTGSSGAKKSLKANWLWLNRFDTIILWFDDDEPGRAATEECATLFAVGKVRIAKVPGCKDASDVLQRSPPTPGDIEAAIFMATLWRPPGIINASTTPDDVCSPKDDASHWQYAWPWAPLDDYLGPIQPGQVVYHVAATGIGKTTAIAEIEWDLIGQGAKIAHLGFEDTRRDVKLRLMTIATSLRLDIEQLPDDEMRELHQKVFGDGSFELFDPESAEWSFEAVMGYVRYCAKALDCKVIFIDPLTFIAGLMRVGDDMQRALENAATELALIAKELGVHIQVAHHLTEPRGDGPKLTEGGQTSINQVRGSGGIANFAVIVIGHERNQQAPGDLALLTQLRSLKNRPRSKTGTMMVLAYDLATGRLKPTDKPFPGDGKRHSKPSFGDASGPPSSTTDY